MVIRTMDELITGASGIGKKKLAVVAAQDSHSLEAIKMAADQGLVDPILIGDAEQIRNMLAQVGGLKETPAIIDAEDDQASAEMAVELVKQGKADLIMKGKLNSSAFLKPVVSKSGLYVGSIISHLTILSLPGYHKLVGLTDCAMNIQPGLEQKVAIVRNAIAAFHHVGYEQPKVALLCANEEVTPKQQDTVDAQTIQEMAERGELGNCIVSGPISFDIAMDGKAAAQKGFESPVAGDPDILMVPNMVCGNVLNKALKQFGGSTACGTVIGAKCPLVLTSRSSSAKSKWMSIAVSVAIA